MNELKLVVGPPAIGRSPHTAHSEKAIVLLVKTENGSRTTRLLERTSDIEVLLDWSDRCRKALLEEEAPAYLPKSDTLARSVEHHYRTASLDKIAKTDDDLYRFRCRHDLRLAFRDTDMPSIFIGKWGGAHTISSLINGGFSYAIDLPRFIAELSAQRSAMSAMTQPQGGR